MIENSVIAFTNPDQIEDPLTDLLKAGAKLLIQHALKAELEVLLEQYQYRLTDDGKAAVLYAMAINRRETSRQALGPLRLKSPKSATGRVPLLSFTQPSYPLQPENTHS